MAIDLISLVSQVLTPTIVGAIARATGINEAVAQKLVAAAIPTVLGALGTAAAAPGGAQKLVDAVSNSDPDLLTTLSGALGGGDFRAATDGANLLSGVLGASGLSSLVGALSQYSGAAQPAAQTAIGSVVQAAVGTLGQQDPGNWADARSLAGLFGAQTSAISAALPPEISKALGATGLLAGLGGLASAAAQSASNATASAASAAASAAQQAARAVPTAAPAAPSSSGFPMWAVILLIVIVLAAVWWFMTQNQKAEPAKTGMAPTAIELALRALPGPRA